MSVKKLKNSQKAVKNESRVLPLFIVGLFCFAIAALLGFGAWRVFGSQARERGDTARYLKYLGLSWSAKPTPTPTPTPNTAVVKKTPVAPEVTPTEPETEIATEISGVVAVEGTEFSIGGGETQRPIQRVLVDDFSIAETEVTNEQYAEFVEAAGHRSPSGWINGKFPEGTEKFPVVNVSLNDANAFCEWLSEKYKMKVRLPTQAEWELAAGGEKDFRYPWGNEWNDEGVDPKETKKASPVKSFPVNKSPFGAYDMVGNVWEWTSEKVLYKELESDIAKKGSDKTDKVYLILGGAFDEDRKILRNNLWTEVKAETRINSLGFRYVIIPNETNN